jgi:hypothetical protein
MYITAENPRKSKANNNVAIKRRVRLLHHPDFKMATSIVLGLVTLILMILFVATPMTTNTVENVGGNSLTATLWTLGLTVVVSIATYVVIGWAQKRSPQKYKKPSRRKNKA